MSVRIGIIANPVSARDIRRITSRAAGLALGERAHMLLRMMQALAACGLDEVLLMPEMEGLRRLVDHQLPGLASECRHPLPAMRWLDMTVRNSTADSVHAAAMMRDEGVPLILVLGGDGTHRAVVKGCGGAVPVAGISSGTNNAFPPMREVTVTAWAAGLFAAGRVSPEIALKPNKCLMVRKFDADGREVQTEPALIDVAVLNEVILGARAISDSLTLKRVIVTQASLEAVGLSAVAAALQPVGRFEPGGLMVAFASEQRDANPSDEAFSVQAVLAPGRVDDIRIRSFGRFLAGESCRVEGSALIALDGEREIALRDGEYARVELQEQAFATLDVPAVLAAACSDRLASARRHE